MTASAPRTAEAEIPDVGRVDCFPHPRETTDLVGHETAEMTLLEAVKSGRMHHAWLVTGPRGIGKATLAYRFARFLLARRDGNAKPANDLGVSADSAVFRQIAGRAHPDLLVLSRPWNPQRKRHATAVTVDEARRLRPFFGQTAAGGAWRVVIVDSADELNLSAANAVLKSLEEPPPQCVFLLVAAAPGRLPATVRSRCRTLRLGPLAPGDVRIVVERAHERAGIELPEPQAVESCIALARGSPGAALRLIADGGAELHGALMAILSTLPAPDFGAVHRLGDTLTAASAEGRYELFHMMLDDTVARLVVVAAAGGGQGEEVALARRLIGPRGLANWAGLWETLQRMRAEADMLNLDRKTLVLEMFFRLAETARQSAQR